MEENIDKLINDVEARINNKYSVNNDVAEMVRQSIGQPIQQQAEESPDDILAQVEASLAKKKETQVQQEQVPTQPEVRDTTQGNPLQTISSDIVRGYAESSAGFNRKLLAVAKLIDNPILDTDFLQNRLIENVSYWNKVSEQQKYRDPNGWVWNMVGSVPHVAAEFFGTGMGIGSIALRGGVLQAADEYGRKLSEDKGVKLQPGEFVGSFVQGAAVTGATAGLFKGVGVSLEKLGQLIPKYGSKTVQSLMIEMGVSEKNAAEFVTNWGKFKVGQKGEIPSLSKVSERNVRLAEDLKKRQDDELFKMNQDLERQKQTLIESKKSEIRGKEIEYNDSIESNAFATKKAIEELKDANRNEISKIDMNNRDSIAEAVVNQERTLMEARGAFEEQVSSFFGQFKTKLDTYRNAINTETDNIVDRMVAEYPTVGARAENVSRNIQDAINATRVFRAKMNKEGKIEISSNASSVVADEKARILESRINYLLKDNSEKGIVNMYKLRFAKSEYDNLTSAWMKEGSGEFTEIGRVTKNIADALESSRYIDDLPAFANNYRRELKEVLTRYGTSKDVVGGWEALLYKDTPSGQVPRVSEIFKALENGDRSFVEQISRLEKQSDAIKPNTFKVSNELNRMFGNYRSIQREQTSFLEAMKIKNEQAKELAQKTFRENLRGLQANEAIVGEQKRLAGKLLQTMRDSHVRESNKIREALDIKLNKFKNDQKEAYQATLNRMREEEDLIRAQTIMNSWRPKAGIPRVAQNIGAYGAVGSGVAGATGVINPAQSLAGTVIKGALAYTMSPVMLSKAAQWGLTKGKPILKKSSKAVERSGKAIKESKLLQRLIASKISGY